MIYSMSSISITNLDRFGDVEQKSSSKVTRRSITNRNRIIGSFRIRLVSSATRQERKKPERNDYGQR